MPTTRGRRAGAPAAGPPPGGRGPRSPGVTSGSAETGGSITVSASGRENGR
jgi:hypothetical protein